MHARMFPLSGIAGAAGRLSGIRIRANQSSFSRHPFDGSNLCMHYFGYLLDKRTNRTGALANSVRIT